MGSKVKTWKKVKNGLKTRNLDLKPISKVVFKADTGMRVGPKADGTQFYELAASFRRSRASGGVAN